MAISLRKGQKVSLTKNNPSLKKIMVGLGWHANDSYSSYDFDLDASVLLCDENGICRDKSDFVYFGNLQHPSGSVIHMGDNLVGSYDYEQNDDEQIMVDLSKIPHQVQKIVFGVTIYKAEERGQNFGQVSNAFIRLVDQSTNKEIIRYDLTEDFYNETAVVVGEIYKYKSEWKFNAIGSGFMGGISEFLSHYGLSFGQGLDSRTVGEVLVLKLVHIFRETNDVELLSILRNLSEADLDSVVVNLSQTLKILSNT